ncbi:4'-phosphopantetheinyl transferase superfamily protein [Streptomyces sp. MK5]|uniref:4'-phosphopantetheinyl transferase family protein n=1 Tax=Streptomyces sp. MK5 TaxID=3064253 RepID=UPI002740B30E|nr:4'-phosphopantetheinyl transferase superfamily protein [Streptomyces sp. MK5]
MSGRQAVRADATEPLYVACPDGPWTEAQNRFREHGRLVVHTTWGAWAPAALLDPALPRLLDRDWPRYRQLPNAEQRLGFAASRYVMKYTAAAAVEACVDEIDLVYQPGGRPGLRGRDDITLSLAHTDELLVVGVSRTGPIGVDAELADRDINFDLMSGHVCTPEEEARLSALPVSERASRLLRLWTLKEAYTKALGYGLRRRFSTVGFAQEETGAAVLAAPVADAADWEFRTHRVQGRYLVSEAHRRDRAASQAPPGDGRGWV